MSISTSENVGRDTICRAPQTSPLAQEKHRSLCYLIQLLYITISPILCLCKIWLTEREAWQLSLCRAAERDGTLAWNPGNFFFFGSGLDFVLWHLTSLEVQ